MNFRWDDVRVLLALHEHQSLSAAAQELGVNASTVGRRLEALETELDVSLFDRTREGVRPTAAVEALLAPARELEHAAADFGRAASGFERVAQGVVRVTAPPGIAQLMLAPHLPKLLKSHPGIRIHLDSSIGYADLTRRDADIAIRGRRPTTGDLVARSLGESRPDILAAPRYAKQLGCLSNVDDARWIDWGESLAHIAPARWVAKHVNADRVVLRTNGIASQLAAARAGLGVVLLTQSVAKAAGLRVVELSSQLRSQLDKESSDQLWLVGHRALRQVPRVAAVWDFLLESAGLLNEDSA